MNKSLRSREAVSLLRLAGPLVVGNLGIVAIQVTDTMMIGRVSPTALAAVGLAAHLSLVVSLLCTGTVEAVAPLVAQARGRQTTCADTVVSIVRHGALLGLIMCMPLCALLWDAAWAFPGAGQVREIGTSYLRYFLFAIPGMVVATALRSCVVGMEQSRLVLYVSLATVVVNFLGNWILIFGHLGAPALGADGAALSSVFATAFSIALYILLINTNASLRELRLFSRAVRVCLAGLWEVARLGIPIGLILLVEISFFTTAAVLVGGFGVAQLAGHQIAVQVVAFTLMFPLAIGHAATVRVALFAGSADPRRARIAAQLPLLITVIMMIALAVILWWQAQNIAAVFLGDGSGETYSATLIQAVAFLKIAAVFQIVDGLQATAAGVLRGYRDTLVPLWLASAAYWIVGIPLGYVLASQLGLAGRGVWLGMATALSLCALGMLLRVHSIARVVEPQNQTGDRL